MDTLKIVVGFIFCLLGAFVGGLAAANVIRVQSAKMQAKYPIGTCLSNGLYYEKIIEIRKGSVISEARYVLSPTIQGKVSAPTVTAAWIVDEGYVQIGTRNCL